MKSKNKKIFKLYNNHKRIILSLSIFAMVIFVLGIPYINWWFYGADDSHGLFLGYKTKTLKALLYFFYNGHPNQGAGPSNCIISIARTSFFDTYYRPLQCIILSLEYKLFGTAAYGYFLTNIFFHAINTTVLFNIFLYFLNYFPSFLCTMLFALHPQIAYRFGAIVNVQYYVNLTLIFLIFILFKKYLDSKKSIYNLYTCILFLISLFLRETSIILPAIIFLGCYFYENKSQKISLKTFFEQFLYNLKITFGLWSVAFGFLALRLYLYPLKFDSDQQQTISFFQNIKIKILSKFPEFQVFIYDFLSLSWLPWGHKMLRGIIVISLFALFIWLFIKNNKKIYILYFLFSMMLMLWPSLMGPYSPRYFYEAQPFALLTLIFLFKFHKTPLTKFKKIGLFIFSIYIIFLTYFTIESFTLREKKMYQISSAIEELIKNPKIKNRNLCFFGYPAEAWGNQNAAIFWVQLNNPTLKMYFDSATAITQQNSNVVTPTKWRNKISQFFDQNFVEIKREKNNEFRFISLNPKKVFFTLDDGEYSLGEKIIHKKESIAGNEQVTDFSLIIDEKYMKNTPIFIKWNYKTKQFDIIN